MRVIVAARLSRKPKKDQRGEDIPDVQQGIGIDTQDQRSREWAEREGHEVITDPIADTKSGTVAPWDRRNLRPWVTDPALMNRYDGIVAYKNDRLSRGVWADEVRIRLWAEQHGKRLMIVDGPQWPPRHDGDKWAWEAQADQARKEWEAGRERSMRAQAALRDRGKLVGRYPWGYASAGVKYDRRMVIDWSLSYEGEDGQRVHYAREVYRRVAGGQSLTVVAAWLADVTGRPWWPRTVAALIRNPTYRGSHQDAGGREIHKCEALVTGQLWRDAVASLDARPGRGTHAAEACALSGVLRCIKCGGPMYRIMTGSGSQARVPYYRCAGTGPVRRSACRNMVRLDAMDALADDVMAALDTAVIEWRLIKGHSHDAERADVELALRDLAGQGLAEDAEDAERARLRAERARLRALPGVPDRWEPRETGETYAQQWAALAPAARRDWLRAYAPRLYAGKPGMEAVLFAGEDEPGITDPGHRATMHYGHGIVLSVVWRVASS